MCVGVLVDIISFRYSRRAAENEDGEQKILRFFSAAMEFGEFCFLPTKIQKLGGGFLLISGCLRQTKERILIHSLAGVFNITSVRMCTIQLYILSTNLETVFFGQ